VYAGELRDEKRREGRIMGKGNGNQGLEMLMEQGNRKGTMLVSSCNRAQDNSSSSSWLGEGWEWCNHL